ncbi:MAG TPA: thiol-activated cytolysin family protein [Candidatus Krumholzibacteria bacterium]|nr:thiol-activated cytolysin family protein [Candidatus Krumholzibacteria bacterium]
MFSRNRIAVLLLGLMAAAVSCSKNNPTATSTEPVDPAQVNKFVNALPDWIAPSDVEDPPLDLGDSEDLENSQYYRCHAVEYDLKRNFDDIIAVGSNATALKPGMMVQGRGVKDGTLNTIGLKRSPLSLSINLALADPSRDIETPNSSSIQDAIASLQREADDRLGDLDVVPAQINFSATSAYSKEQAMLSAGLSLRYNAVLSSGSVAGSLSQSSAITRHTVLVKLLQPMYTISFADDQKAEPADFFAPDLMQADFERQQELGTMGAGNLPCYVQSVTYGRMVVYSMSTTESTTDDEYKLAVQASYGAWSGSGSVSTRQKSLVQNSTVEVQVFGGTQGQGLDAIKTALKSGDFSAFLQAAPATTAVPLSYRINDLKNRQPATIGDATRFKIQQCEAVNDLQFTTSLDSVIVVNGCDAETGFDIECFATMFNPMSSHTLVHVTPPTYSFPKESLPSLSGIAIFTVTAGSDSRLEFLTDVGSTSGTGLGGWSAKTVFNYPFDFPTNPYHFTQLQTTTDSKYRSCTLQLFFTVKRQLAQ